MRDIVRGILIAFRNMFIELGYLILILVLGLFIPIIGGMLGTVILFFIASYFYGFAFVDYVNERRRLTLKQSVQFIRANKGLAIGNGFIFTMAMFIPMCGTTLAGFVAIVSVIAATIAVHEVVDLSDNKFAENKFNMDAMDGDDDVTDNDQKTIDGSTED